MQKAVKGILLSSAAAAVLVATSVSANAGAFALREQSTRAQGQAFAGAAAGSGGLSSMYWNPATMTDQDGITTELNVAALLPYSNVKPQAGTSPVLLALGGLQSSGDIGFDAWLPSSYASYQINDRFWVGLATNTPYGLATKYTSPYAGQIYAQTSRVFSFSVNPTLAVKLTDWLSVGVGPQALYFATDLSRALSPVPFSPKAELEGDDWGFGFTAGVTVKPMEGTSIGIGYRSAVDLELRGNLRLDGPAGPLPPGTYGIDADVTLPEVVTIGLQQTVSDDVRLSAGFEWTNWSRLGTIPVVSNSGPLTGTPLTQLTFEYGDGYYASVGGEYDWNEKLTLRAGVAYEWSPIDVDTRDLRLPDSDRLHLNAGAGYKLNEHITLDFAYLHIITTGDTDIELTPGNPSAIPGLPFVGSVDSHVDIFSVSGTYRF